MFRNIKKDDQPMNRGFQISFCFYFWVPVVELKPMHSIKSY